MTETGRWNTNIDNVVIDGYDPVAYFEESQPVRGRKELATDYNGVTFHFASEAHREKFLAGPEQYLPQYGGWCAFAIAAKEAKVPANPRTFKIYRGKLHLFFDDVYEGEPLNTKLLWDAAEEEMHTQADATWPTLA